MRINTIRIPCLDLAEATVFYETAIGLQGKFGSTEKGYVGFQLENAQLLLEPQERGEFECGRYLGFSIEVEDIFLFYAECQKRGVSFTAAPQIQHWGGTMTHIKDCSGNTFSVVQSTPQ